MNKKRLVISLTLAAYLLSVSISTTEANYLALNQITFTPTPSTYIKISLIVYSGIPVLNNVPRLVIGNKQFRTGSGLRTVDFALTPEEFASVKNGDQVMILFDRVYLFGPLDKNSLTMQEQLKLEKQVALDKLIQLRNEATNSRYPTKLDPAIQLLTDSLLPTRWLDTLHLQPAQGLAVFDADMNAVALLQDMNNAKPSVELSVILADIVHVDRSLAAVAIDEATATGGAKSLINQSSEAFEQGYVDPHNESYVSAVARYREAWFYAQKAVEDAPTPTVSRTSTPLPSAKP